MASLKDNPVLAELDSIAMELEKTGNADLASLVDECSAELLSAPVKKASKKKPARKTRRSKKNRKSAGAERSRKRTRIAAAMRKIARAQVGELEDIAAELLNEGEKNAALEVLKIAQELDSDYEYSSEGGHDEPSTSGDASKQYDRKKKNSPSPKGDDPKLDEPYEEGEGYPFNDGEKSAFTSQLDNLIRLAMDEGEDDAMDFGADEESMEEDSEDMEEDSEDMEEDALDMEEDSEDMEEEEAEHMEDDDDDELAAMMKSMLGDDEDEDAMEFDDESDDEDHEAADRMYGAEDDMGEDADDLDLGDLDLGDEEEGEDEMGMEEDEDEDADDMDMEEDDMGMSDDPALDDDGDKEALLGFDAELNTPLGGVHLGSLKDKKKVAALAKKLWGQGQKDLARRVASLIKNK